MPRPVHFEIQAENTERAIEFYTDLFAWKFSQWGKEKYWLITTGEQGARRASTAACCRGAAPDAPEMAAVNAFVCTVDVADLDATVAKVARARAARVVAAADADPDASASSRTRKDTEGNIFGMMQMDANAK